MAANDPNTRSDRPPPSQFECLATVTLDARLEEEIGRAERHGTALSCLLVVIENLDELARAHGSELREQTLGYVAGALAHELRRFDRVGCALGGLVIVLPGADGPRGEVVARRALERLRAIKVEAEGARRQLEITVGLAAWSKDTGAQALLARAHSALRTVNGDQTPAHGAAPGHAAAEARQGTAASGSRLSGGTSSAPGGAGGA